MRLGDLRLGILKRDLHVLEPGVLQPLGALAREAERGGDERLIEAERVRVRDELLEIAADERLAAGQSELQHAELRAPRVKTRFHSSVESSACERARSSGLEQ